MAIDAPSSAAFVHGSGVDAATLQMTVVSVVAVGVLLWLAWTALALWRDWRDGSLGLMDLQWGLMRATALGLLLIFLIRCAVWLLLDETESKHMHPNKRHLLRSLTTVGLVFAVAADQALAALPAPVAPSTAPAASDWLGLIKGYIKDGGIIILETAVDRFDAVDTPQGFRPSSLLPISPLGEAATYPMARQAT